MRPAAKRKQTKATISPDDGVEELSSYTTRKHGKVTDMVCTRRHPDGTIEHVARVERKDRLEKLERGESYSKSEVYAFGTSFQEYRVFWLQGTV